jgi:hypothetical protein
MKMVLSLAVLVGLLGSLPPTNHDDLQQLCPVGAGLAVLRGAPWDGKLAAIRATHARIEQRLQRMEEHLQRLERLYPARRPGDESN